MIVIQPHIIRGEKDYTYFLNNSYIDTINIGLVYIRGLTIACSLYNFL